MEEFDVVPYFTTRTRNCLNRAGIPLEKTNRYDDLVFIKLPNCGRKCLEEIRKVGGPYIGPEEKVRSDLPRTFVFFFTSCNELENISNLIPVEFGKEESDRLVLINKKGTDLTGVDEVIPELEEEWASISLIPIEDLVIAKNRYWIIILRPYNTLEELFELYMCFIDGSGTGDKSLDEWGNVQVCGLEDDTWDSYYHSYLFAMFGK